MGIRSLLSHKYLCSLKELVPVLHILVIKGSYYEFHLRGLFYVKPGIFPSLSLYQVFQFC